MRRIKVAQVITRLDWAGSTDIVRIICESLDAPYETRLITGSSKHLTRKTENFLQRFKDKVVLVPHMRRDINPLHDFLALVRLYLIFRRERFDIVHTHTAKAGILGRTAAYLAGTRRIVHMPHGHNFYGYFGPSLSRFVIGLERVVARFTDKIVVLTELARKDFSSFKIKNAKDIDVVPSGLEIRDFDSITGEIRAGKRGQLGLGHDEKAVGVVSRLEPIKGLQYFIEAARRVSARIDKVRFLIAGEGALRHDLEGLARESGLQEKIVFLGWREDTLEIISSLDVLVLPSLNEAVGRVLLEAQALGVPVVATKVGGIPEVVRDGITGILVPPGDSPALAQAICHLLDDDKQKRKFSEEGKRWVRGKFSSERMMHEIFRIYDELVNR